MDHVLFKHLPNKRGGYDSICMRCFAVVAVRRYGSHLTRADTRHKCDDEQVANLQLWLDRLKLL